MRTAVKTLLHDPRFIPFVYDYCDKWCERCRTTSRCLLFATYQNRSTQLSAEAQTEAAIALARAIVGHTPPAHRAVAELDLAFCDVSTAPREPAIGHPLEFLARHYAVQSAQYLASHEGSSDEQWARGSPLETVAWFHFLIAAKTYRALVSHFASEHTPELLTDALGSAKLVLVAIDRSLDGWRSIADHEEDARVGALIEVLEALRTGVEMRFPEARAFRRPGLDDGDA